MRWLGKWFMIAVVSLKDSIRKLTDDGKSFSRKGNTSDWQTLQTFKLKNQKGFEAAELYHFTDDTV